MIIWYYSQAEHSYDMQQTVVQGGATIPAAIPLAIVGSASNFLNQRIIINAGNEDTFPKFTITGPGTGFTITNTVTGKSFVLSSTLTYTDSVVIDTYPLKRTVIKNGTDDLYPNFSGDFWPLAPGENEINFLVAGGAGATTLLNTRFRDAYSGMPYRILCNGELQKSLEARPGLGLAPYHFRPLHKIRYGIDALGQFAVFRNLTFGKKLNNYGSCSFDVPMTDPKINSLIALRQYTIEIYRNNVLLWAGEQAIRKKAKKSSGDNWATIYCYDWLEQLNSRFTGELRIFTNTDAGQIAWTLIAETQAQSSLGITQGTIEATQNRDRTYNNQNIMEAIINLSNVINGFDFEINNSKIFNVKSRIGVDRSNLIFEYGINVSEYDLTDDFSQPVNRAIVIGVSGNATDPLRVQREDPISKALIGLREGLDNEMTVSETGTLNDKGDAITRKYSKALRKIENMKLVKSSSPTIADFALGDIITFKDTEENIEDQFRVFEWNVKFDTDNSELLDLVIGDFVLL